ncbi:MAG: DUF1178 family protein [Alphaproteobacteria bacterium]|nr:DUF1178 family protein [Alphaproteobacteria bacterium]
MILYSLRCAKDHEFDGWFRDSAGFDEQCESGFLACPTCGSTEVSKALMAPRVMSSKEASVTISAQAKQAMPQAVELKRKLLALRRAVEENCDYVGGGFAEEARKIHYGEAEAHGIYGETTPDEAERLREEGVEFGAIPWVREDT